MKQTIFAVFDGDKPCSYELLACARSLGGEVCAVYLSDNEAPSDEMFNSGADVVYSVVDKKLEKFNGRYHSEALYQLIKEKKPDIVIFCATQNGRELAPAVSTALNTGLTADCTSLSLTEDFKLASIRPTFGGRLMAEILCKTLPQMSTLRPGSYSRIEYSDSPKILEKFYPDLSAVTSSIEIIEVIKSIEIDLNLSGAQVILAGGKGLKTKENFQKLEDIVKYFNSPRVALGASRGAVDMGIAPRHAQIGQTGLSVSPKLYVAFGISGAIHHLVGIKNAETIIAVNIDESAPIFFNCDYKIKTDAISLLDELHRNL